MKPIIILFLITSLILESTITTLPLILLVLLCSTVVFKDNWLFLAAFVFGLLLDIVTFKTPGLTSTFLSVFLFSVLLYQNKFEINTSQFVFVASFMGSYIFLLILGYTNSIIVESIFSAIIGVVLFKTFQKFNKTLSNSSKSI